jgi:hypothetical protein
MSIARLPAPDSAVPDERGVSGDRFVFRSLLFGDSRPTVGGVRCEQPMGNPRREPGEQTGTSCPRSPTGPASTVHPGGFSSCSGTVSAPGTPRDGSPAGVIRR